MSRHNHTDAWLCNSSCPVHPDHASLVTRLKAKAKELHLTHPQPEIIRQTEDYIILSVRPPSNERELFPQYWLFDVEGPRVNKIYIGTTEQCGGQFIQALQGAYDAGVSNGFHEGHQAGRIHG